MLDIVMPRRPVAPKTGRILTVCLALLALIALAAKARAQNAPLCMSHEEFRAYLHETLLFQVGYGGAVCCARDKSRPGSCRTVIRQAKTIESVAANYFYRNREKALKPFARAFPNRAEEALRQHSDTLEARARQFVDNFNDNECAAWLNAIEALSFLREDDLGEFLTSQLVTPAEFSREREQIAVCE